MRPSNLVGQCVPPAESKDQNSKIELLNFQRLLETFDIELSTRRAGSITKLSEYEKLVLETRKPVSNAHLFDDEDESYDSESPANEPALASSLVSSGERKRRQSRGGINIAVLNAQTASEEEPVDKKARV